MSQYWWLYVWCMFNTLLNIVAFTLITMTNRTIIKLAEIIKQGRVLGL